MEKEVAIITEIQRFSIHDGLGIRTSVFFKGCPLRCSWCHNPECISPKTQVMYYPEKCINCGKCSEGCFSGAKVLCGEKYTVKDLLSKILQDKSYYKNDGGVTLTGGEPLEQASFLKNFIPACKEHKIHVAMESCMFIWDKNIFSQADYLMSDLKIWDNEKHIRFTGVSNAKIKENILKADELGIPILLRTPVVKGINDTKEEIQNIRNFAKSLKHVVGYELLPYHPLGIPKRKALGMPVEEFSQPEKETMETLKKYADL